MPFGRKAKPAITSDELTVRNDQSIPIALVIEPSGDSFWLEPGASARMVASGPNGGRLQLVELPGRLEIFLWTGATGSLFDGASGDLVAEYPNPFPGGPPGMTLVEFVHWMNDHTAWYPPNADRRIPGTRQVVN
jgi:hypothetical protein